MIKTGSPRVEEMPLIYDSWISSYRRSPWAGVIRNDKWHEFMSDTVRNLLIDSTVICGFPQDDAVRRVVGYVVVQKPNILHYVYVKQKYRGIGVANQLIEAATGFLGCETGIYTFKTKASEFLDKRGWKFDPVPARTV